VTRTGAEESGERSEWLRWPVFAAFGADSSRRLPEAYWAPIATLLIRQS
jgi:hypothetical protein